MSNDPITIPRNDEFPRTITAALTDCDEWAQIEAIYELLEKEIEAVASVEDLMGWLERRSEFDAVLSEEASRRYVAMTCATGDEEKKKAFLSFVENIEPKISPWSDKLDRLYLACPFREQADRERLEVLNRNSAVSVELFREENIPLKTELTRLSQQYQETCGAMTVEWEGEERTLQQMAPVQEELDRTKRERAWRLVTERRMQDSEKLDALFEEMVAVRTRVAKNAGFENFRDYKHKAMARFDYTPADCATFHETVEREVVPLVAKLNEERRAKLGVETLRPWDMSVDPDGLPPLRPCKDAEELAAKCAQAFTAISAPLGEQFEQMRSLKLLDLDSRKGKAPGGYQCGLDEVRLPFIFMNAAGTNSDVFTLLHEGGHAFHQYAHRNDPFVWYRTAPMEFAEVASMSMELFSYQHLGFFYPDVNDLKRTQRNHLEKVIDILPWVATVDAFQHWIYLNPESGAEARHEKFKELYNRFMPGTDWSGLETELGVLWHRQLHLFEVPFYYIEYGIAQLGALQLWMRFGQDPEAAIASYRRALALGASRPLPELYEAAGARFDFSSETIAPIMQEVASVLGTLSE